MTTRNQGGSPLGKRSWIQLCIYLILVNVDLKIIL